MTKFKKKYRIESNRWEFWNYSAPGAYFITICTINREQSLGWIDEGKMRLSRAGEIVKKNIQSLWQYHKRLVIDEWVIMPNHIHLIITLGEMDFDNAGLKDEWNDGVDVERIHDFSLQHKNAIHEFSLQMVWDINNYAERFMLPIALLTDITDADMKAYRKLRRQMVIPMVIGKVKMQISKEINILNETPERKNWQENYHDHIIRNELSYLNIKQYIINNPIKWKDDTFFN